MSESNSPSSDNPNDAQRPSASADAAQPNSCQVSEIEPAAAPRGRRPSRAASHTPRRQGSPAPPPSRRPPPSPASSYASVLRSVPAIQKWTVASLRQALSNADRAAIRPRLVAPHTLGLSKPPPPRGKAFVPPAAVAGLRQAWAAPQTPQPGIDGGPKPEHVERLEVLIFDREWSLLIESSTVVSFIEMAGNYRGEPSRNSSPKGTGSASSTGSFQYPGSTSFSLSTCCPQPSSTTSTTTASRSPTSKEQAYECGPFGSTASLQAQDSN
ncbi:hypothetical protein Q8A67_024215 [Cirrhinus molitorella]|uniref:Uncharacterized protein n=1 Tax=Cirrhinus molitorella TaxID=172907 RepID=A0AA88TBK2_9TELE|nr:hypothetical protein Q8A67_024215 [Cirrhinus molitorella]